MAVNLGIIGAGYWGINHVRTFNQLNDCNLLKVSDLFEQSHERVKNINKNIITTTDYKEVVNDPDIEAVVIASSSETHFPIAKEALLNGKHTFVEKPICLNVEEAEELIKIAEEKNLRLMVGHLLLYHSAITWIKNYIDSGEIGDIHYIYSHRLNLGKIRTVENSLWSLAPHDISVMQYLVDSPVKKSWGVGKSYVNEGIEDIYFFSIEFENGILGHGHVSWLDPNKTRKFTIVGSKKMIIFDDVSSTEKIKIFDKGVGQEVYGSYGESQTLRDGDIHSPAVKITEPLKIECQHFLDCVRTGETPLSDGRNGLKVVKSLVDITNN